MIDYDYITNRPSPVVPTNAKAEIQAAFAFVTYLRNRHACLKDAQMFSRDSQVLFVDGQVNRPGFPGECFICELRLP
ncbi:hypothetical protein, partial [Escherichia coli]|uniref:hypothetical protein n=1 Tax=Escherichia coli TaxID=562 RepID=UPI0024117C84